LEKAVQKGEQVYTSDGWSLSATDDAELQIMQFQDECICRLALAIHHMLRGHALSTNFVQAYGSHALVVKALEMVPLTVVARTTATDVQLSLIGSLGTELSEKEAEGVPLAKPSRLDTMKDVATHSARCLRAHLSPLGYANLELRFHFGVASGGETLLQVPNPIACNLGTNDYETLCGQIGGKDF
jgi:hypothetical protein